MQYEQRFGHVTAVRELADGSVLVADPRKNRLEAITGAGARRTLIDGEALGAKMFFQIGAMFPLGGDSTLVITGAGGRSAVLRGQEIVGTVESGRVGRATIIGADTLGDLLWRMQFVARRTKTTAATITEDSAIVMVGRLSSRHVDTVARLGGASRRLTTIRESEAFAVRASPFATEDQVKMLPAGQLAIAYPRSYRVEVLGRDGTRRAVHESAFEPRAVTDVDKRVALGPERRIRGASLDSGTNDRPQLMPAFLTNALVSAPEGILLVRRAIIDEARRPVYDLISLREGRIGSLSMLENETIVGFGRGSVYVDAQMGRDDGRLRRYPWPPVSAKPSPKR